MHRLLTSRFGGLYCWGLLFLVAMFVVRTVLTATSIQVGGLTPREILEAYLLGSLFDLVAFFYCAAPLAIYEILVPDRFKKTKASRWFSIALYAVGIFAVLFDVAAEWFFWDEFGHRFNFIAVDYLVYTHEVVGNIAESYPLKTILACLALLTGVIVLATSRYALMGLQATSTFGQRLRAGFVFLTIPIVSYFCVHNRLAEFSENQYANELAKNGVHSLANAFWKNVIDYEAFYAVEDTPTAFCRLHAKHASAILRIVVGPRCF